MERKRDELWETLVDVCQANAAEMTRSERGRYNHALKQLKEVGASSDQLRARAGRYRSRYPGIDLTPTALAAHWSSLRPPPPPRSNPLFDHHREKPTEESTVCTQHGLAHCPECAERARQKFFEQAKTIGEMPGEVSVAVLFWVLVGCLVFAVALSVAR